MVKQKDCDTTLTICIHEDVNDSIEIYQKYIQRIEKKTGFNKSQTINRIIREWVEDHPLTLEVAKKEK